MRRLMLTLLFVLLSQSAFARPPVIIKGTDAGVSDGWAYVNWHIEPSRPPVIIKFGNWLLWLLGRG